MPPVQGQLGYYNENGIPGSLPTSSSHAPVFMGGFTTEQTRMSDAQTNCISIVPARSAEASALSKDAVRFQCALFGVDCAAYRVDPYQMYNSSEQMEFSAFAFYLHVPSLCVVQHTMCSVRQLLMASLVSENMQVQAQGDKSKVVGTGLTCRTDESAASILMSLKGSS